MPLQGHKLDYDLHTGGTTCVGWEPLSHRTGRVPLPGASIASMVSIFISQGCQGPQTGWLKTTEVYCLPVLEAGRPESSLAGPAPPEGSGGGPFFASSGFRRLRQSLAFPSVQLQHVSLCIHHHMALSPHVSVFLTLFSSSYKDISHIGLRAPPHSSMTSAQFTSTTTQFQIISHSEVLTGG